MPGPPATAGSARERLDVVTFGEALVSFRSAGPAALGSPMVPSLAGAESNVAIGLARLGHRAAWVGRLGADLFGDLAHRELRGEDVDVRYVVRDPHAPRGALTGLMFLEHRTADVSRVEYRRAGSAGSRLQVADLLPALAEPPRVLHWTGITPALSADARDACEAAIRSAVEAGAYISLDVNHRSSLWSRDTASSVLRDLVGHTDLVVASEDELDLVADGDEAAAVGALLDLGVDRVVVKRGAAGASLWTAADRIDCPALQVTAIDTVGAGDAFCAGFLSGLLDGLDGAGCLARGVLIGGYAVSTLGDWEGLPRRAELDLLGVVRAGDTLR